MALTPCCCFAARLTGHITTVRPGGQQRKATPCAAPQRLTTATPCAAPQPLHGNGGDFPTGLPPTLICYLNSSQIMLNPSCSIHPQHIHDSSAARLYTREHDPPLPSRAYPPHGHIIAQNKRNLPLLTPTLPPSLSRSHPPHGHIIALDLISPLPPPNKALGDRPGRKNRELPEGQDKKKIPFSYLFPAATLLPLTHGGSFICLHRGRSKWGANLPRKRRRPSRRPQARKRCAIRPPRPAPITPPPVRLCQHPLSARTPPVCPTSTWVQFTST